jgi:hypothetical protein
MAAVTRHGRACPGLRRFVTTTKAGEDGLKQANNTVGTSN